MFRSSAESRLLRLPRGFVTSWPAYVPLALFRRACFLHTEPIHGDMVAEVRSNSNGRSAAGFERSVPSSSSRSFPNVYNDSVALRLGVEYSRDVLNTASLAPILS